MRLLLTTQVVDKNDTNLGFFHEWIVRLAPQFTSIEIICLKKGEYTLPENVQVHSLGKETRPTNAIVYALRFYKLLLTKLWGKYDNVFVHMNPEYVILGGLWWRLTGKKVLLWYVHKAVNFRLRIAEKFATKIFTASKVSFRLKSKKVQIVGHGIPIDLFSEQKSKPGDVIFLMTAGRISRSKDLEVVFKALVEVKNLKLQFYWNEYGRTITEDDKIYKLELDKKVLELGLPVKIQDVRHVYAQMPLLYKSNHVLLHTSQTGSLDKVVLEALASGRLVISTSEAIKDISSDLKGIVYYCNPGDYKAIAQTILDISQNGALQTIPNQAAIDYVRQHHDLTRLVGIIANYFKS